MKLPTMTFDASKITGQYQLLAAFLMVLGSGMGYWMFRADSMMERLFPGFVMALVLLSFLYVVIQLHFGHFEVAGGQEVPYDR